MGGLLSFSVGATGSFSQPRKALCGGRKVTHRLESSGLGANPSSVVSRLHGRQRARRPVLRHPRSQPPGREGAAYAAPASAAHPLQVGLSRRLLVREHHAAPLGPLLRPPQLDLRQRAPRADRQLVLHLRRPGGRHFQVEAEGREGQQQKPQLELRWDRPAGTQAGRAAATGRGVDRPTWQRLGATCLIETGVEMRKVVKNVDLDSNSGPAAF